jgi:hypothetical protein
MANQEPSEYVELATAAYTLLADNYTSATSRSLEYWKSVWQVASKPFSTTAPDATMRESFDRMNQIVGLTVGELSASGRQTSELAEKLLAHSAKVQDTYVNMSRGLANTGISNLNFVKDTAERQIGDMSKRFEDMQAVTVSSQN